MTSQEDQDFANYISSVIVELQKIFSYIIPWLGLAFAIFAFIALVRPRRRARGKLLLIYIFQWRYAIAIMYWLNMIFNDEQFSNNLFNYSLRQAVPDPICKLSNLFLKFFYCASPWIQVVITFDRIWLMYFENRLKRCKLNVTILILIVLGFVFVVCQVYMAYHTINISVFNSTLNITLNDTLAICSQPDSKLALAQDMIFVIMRIILPFVIMVGFNVVLVNHINNARKVVIRGRKKKREHIFTISVAVINLIFLLCSISVAVYYIVDYYFRLSVASISSHSYYSILLFGTCAKLLSYIFTFSEFFVDIIFNKAFQKEIFSLLRFLISIRFNIEVTSKPNIPNIRETNF